MDLRANLRRLQQIDLELAASRGKLERLVAPAGDDGPEGLAALRARLLDSERALDKARASGRLLELEIAAFDAQVDALESRLYAGAGGSRELTQVEHKLTEVRTAREKAEEKLLEMLYHVEAEQKKASRLSETIRNKEQEMAEKTAFNSSFRAGLESAMAALLAERSELAALIGTSMMARYERVRACGHGVAIVQLNGNCCSGCLVAITDSLAERIRQGGETLQTCENCGRIFA